MTELFPITEVLTFVAFLAGPVWLAALSAAEDARRLKVVRAAEVACMERGGGTRSQNMHRVDETVAGFPSTAVC